MCGKMKVNFHLKNQMLNDKREMKKNPLTAGFVRGRNDFFDVFMYF